MDLAYLQILLKKNKKGIKKFYLKVFGHAQKIKMSIWSVPIQLSGSFSAFTHFDITLH
jgi:hypothetical protein